MDELKKLSLNFSRCANHDGGVRCGSQRLKCPHSCRETGFTSLIRWHWFTFLHALFILMMVTCQVSLMNLECDYLLPIMGEKNLHIAYINYSSYVSVRVIYLNLDYSVYDNDDVWSTFWLVSLLRVIQILKISLVTEFQSVTNCTWFALFVREFSRQPVCAIDS